MSALAVEVAGLRRSYGATVAVDGVDLAVATGECVAVLGPNGAGKTTTVEILEGFRRRDGGDVSVLGTDPAHGGRPWRARLGIVLQSDEERLDATVSELVRHFAGFYSDPRDADDVIDLVGLREKATTRSRTLSGGQRRRLDVALGIVGRPELVFLDEPTTGFDPEARRAFWGLVDGLRADGTTVLLTTHYLEEAERLADRVVVVNRGRVVAEGTPATLGGREARRVVVRWREDGAAREEVTETPTAVVAALAARFDGEVPGLEVVRPTLEDVYLGLVGASGSTGSAADA